MTTRFTTITPLFLVATPAFAEPPQVVADILPVHSLVAKVMGDLGSPELILPPGASPHDFSMRPSQAAALENADVVFWIGEGLTPWMTSPLETLSGDANVIALLDQEGTIRHAFDEEGHDDHDDHADHDDHGHEEHADGHDDHDHGEKEASAEHDDHDHDHDKEETAAADDEHDHDHDHDKEEASAHGDHDHGEEDHAEHGHDDHGDEHASHDDHGHDDHAHDHGEFDPHAWLDPKNGEVWVQIIADTLSTADPDNAATYRANADAAMAELASLSDRMGEHIAPLKDVEFAVFHDAYVYIEERFGIEPAMSLLDHEAQQPGPQRIAELQSGVLENEVKIAFSEPQYDPKIINVVFEGIDITTCEIDPLGSEFDAGPEHYFLSLERLAEVMGSCGR